MKRILASIILTLSLVCVTACGQDASAASKAQVFQTLLSGLRFDGSTLSGGKVYFYSPGTTTAKAVYTTRAKTVEAANPYTLDSNGQAAVFGDGVYDIKVTTSAGTQKAYWYNVALQDVSAAPDNIENYASLTAAVTAIGSTKTRLTINTSTTLSSNTTIPFTLELDITRAGTIAIGAYNLTSNGAISNNGVISGTGNVTINGPYAGLGNIDTSGTVSGIGFDSAERWEAVGDGDDTTAIQSSLDSGAKTINLVPGKTYNVSSPLVVPAGVYIKGNGATINTSTHFKVLDFTDGGGVSDLTMTGAGDTSYESGSIAIGCSGTNNAPAAPTYVSGPEIKNCTISGFGEYGIYFEYVKKAKITGNKIDNVGYAGIGGVSCEDIIVDGNTIKDITVGTPGGDAYGIFIDRKDGTSETEEPRSYRCIITNNIIENVTATGANNGQGIDTHAGVDFIIDGNKIKDCEAGIFLTASSISGTQELAPLRCVVSNNIISGGFSNYGIIVYGARTGASVAEHAEDCVVTGNILSGHGSKTSDTIPSMFISATKNLNVSGNTFKECGGSCVMLDFQNIGFNISGNTIVDPQSTSYANAAGVLVYSIDNRGYVGGNTFRYDNSGLATYVAVNSVRIESGLTGLDLDFGRSTFQGIDATHLTFSAATTGGVKYSGLDRANGGSTIAVTSGGANGITDVTFAKRFPYVPKVTTTLRYPFNGGTKFPILGIDTSVAISETGFRIYATPYDGSTWGATGTLTFDWSAE